jgi:Ca2+-binding RTX toxin-like protein
MAIARFDYGVDFNFLGTNWPATVQFLDDVNITVSATGLPTTTYSDSLRYTDGGAAYPDLLGDGMVFTGGQVTAGTFRAFHFFDGVDRNNYISGFSLDATVINLALMGNFSGFVRAMLAGDDKITLRSGTLSNRVFAGSGQDTISGSAGVDILYGDTGNDQLSGGAGNDQLYGGNGNDVISGGVGNDRLGGGSGADQLSGRTGNDLILGSTGADRLIGGSGNDTLDGGAQADRFVFGLNDGRDVIRDFQDGADKIQITAGSGLVPLSFTDSGSDVVVWFGSTRVLIEDIAFNLISQADFELI